MTLTTSIAVTAPAKINLSLHVCGRRDDGYHLLDSLVVFVAAADRITVRPGGSLTLSVTGPFAAALGSEPDNLVLRAARLLAAKTGMEAHAEIALEKNLPVASGIGGGSSDAAAALRGCARLWATDLHHLSDRDVTALGADVPVCLRRAPAVMRGIGEDISAVESLPPAWLVLANPGAPLATKDVFTALRGRFGPPMDPLPRFTNAGHLAEFLGSQRNDLTAPAIERMPAIGQVLGELEGEPGCLLARLSGSGATCFGLFAGEEGAHMAAQALAVRRPGWWVIATPLLTGPMAENL